MNLGEFHARIARAFGRGTQLTGVIPGYVEEAVQQIETNYTFQYMKRWMDLSIDALSDKPYVISLYNTPVKEPQLLRYVQDDTGRFREVRRIDPQERQTREAGVPTGYWLDGLRAMILDSIPEDDLEMEFHAAVYTSWQSAQDEFEHLLIDRYRSLLISETALVAAVDLRDDRLGGRYQAMNERAWKMVNTSEEALQYGSTDTAMTYYPPYDEFDPNFEKDR